MIWFMKRKRWRIGPKLPFAFDRLCSISLSRTLALFVSIEFGNSYSYNPGQEMIGRVVLFDFDTKNTPLLNIEITLDGLAQNKTANF